MESNYRCAGFQCAGEFSARTRNFCVSKLTLVASASLKLPPLRVGRAILAIASHEDPERLGARIRSQHMVARAGRAVTESNPPWNGADTGIFSPFGTSTRPKINKLASNLVARCTTAINCALLVNANFTQAIRAVMNNCESIGSINRLIHKADTQKYLQPQYFNSKTATHFLPTYCLMHQLGPISEVSSHIWHLINLHRADFALPASSMCSTHRPSLAGRPKLFSYLANRWRRRACSRATSR